MEDVISIHLRRIDPKGLGWSIVAAVLILSLLGLSCIYATEMGLAGEQNAFPRNTVKQILFIFAGLLAIGLICSMNYRHYGRYAYPLFGFMLVLLVLLVVARFVPLAPVIPEIRGACRWIRLPGFQFQPSEFMKIAFVMALARYLRYRKNYRTLPGLIGPLALTLFPMFLILLEPDLGTVILLLPVLFTMLFVAGARKRHLLVIMLLGAVAMPIFYFTVMQDYQRNRLLVLLRQSDDDPRWQMNEGYQLQHSKIALGSGGLFGESFREGMLAGPYVRHRFLPDRHNDFIFSMIGHEWGMAGCLLALVCYAWLVIAGAEIAAGTQDPFGRLLAVGLSVMIASQALVNIGMTMGVMPITGLTLPFVSFGGSSLLTSFLAAAILINVNQRRPVILAKKPFEFGDEED